MGRQGRCLAVCLMRPTLGAPLTSPLPCRPTHTPNGEGASSTRGGRRPSGQYFVRAAGCSNAAWSGESLAMAGARSFTPSSPQVPIEEEDKKADEATKADEEKGEEKKAKDAKEGETVEVEGEWC